MTRDEIKHMRPVKRETYIGNDKIWIRAFEEYNQMNVGWGLSILCRNCRFKVLKFHEGILKEMDDAIELDRKREREESKHNNDLLGSLSNNSPSFLDDFSSLIQDCSSVTGKIEIVKEPGGVDQKESFPSFHQVYVEQWSIGESGDSFSGYIYARYNETDWLKIPYSC